jgi:hypothetical protein
MRDLHTQNRNAERFDTICRQLGLTLWRLQELEGAVAKYYVLVALATRGMGMEAGIALEKTLEGNTFGRTIGLLKAADKIPSEISMRLPAVLKERNWVVHSSLHQELGAIYSDHHCKALMLRLETLTSDTVEILRHIATAAQDFALKGGVDAMEIESFTHQILEKWRGDNEA